MPPVIKPFKSSNRFDQEDADTIVMNLSVRAYEVVYALAKAPRRHSSSLYVVPARWLDPRFERGVGLWGLTRTEALSLLHVVAARLTLDGKGQNLRLSVRGRWVQYTDLSPEQQERVREQSRTRRQAQEAAMQAEARPTWIH